MCQQRFTEEIWNPFNTMCHSTGEPAERERRQVQALFGAGMIAEYIITTTVESVRGWFRGSTDHTDQQRLNVIETEMANLKKHTNEI